MTLLERAREKGTPLIEGSRATLVWQGEIPPLVLSDLHGWEAHPQEMQPHTPGVWQFTFDLPLQAYMEYAFVDSHSGERLPDRWNMQRRVSNGLGKYNHYFYMPEASPTPWARRRRGTPRGTVTRHHIQPGFLAAGRQRAVYLYRPAAEGPFPLLVVFDGRDYLRRARLPAILDSLIAARRVRPIALAMVDNGKAARFLEYACSEATLLLLKEHVLPLVEAHLPLNGERAVMGASMGGLQALYTALRMPDVFSAAISQSGAFQVWGHDFGLSLLPPAKVRVWMDAGQFEGLLEANRHMYAHLRTAGVPVTYQEFVAGHNYTAWRNELPDALMAVFGV